jgi:uncharacterized protein YdeI (YjbR/CyaY-like superfamily)
MNAGEVLSFRDKEEWHCWLEAHCDKEAGAWLEIRRKNSEQPGLKYEDALEVALVFGWINGKMNSVDGDRFILRFSPRKAGSVWSRINREKAERLIDEGRMAPSGIARVEDAKKSGAWDAAYTSLARDEVPEDLRLALAENPAALENFERFANSYRNMYTGWVKGAKTEGTRSKRIAEVVRRSALNQKPGT